MIPIVPAVFVSLLLLQAAGGSQEETVTFGNPYANLDARQTALIDDWFDRFREATGKEVDAEAAYNDLPLSVKTTYEAVTHALMTTGLTDDSGNSLGAAIDRIESIETVQGRVKGTGGDKQFRIYAILKEGTVDVLNASKQFKRGRDNSVYHNGYPFNYRLQGGVPSVQISVSPDLRYADLDVDYRSAKFPMAVFNGHLSSSNSDVQAGNNHDRHVNRWGDSVPGGTTGLAFRCCAREPRTRLRNPSTRSRRSPEKVRAK